jgi:hypothetical protein
MPETRPGIEQTEQDDDRGKGNERTADRVMAQGSINLELLTVELVLPRAMAGFVELRIAMRMEDV